MEFEQQEKTGRRVQSLPDLASGLFSLILSLRTSAAYGAEPALRAKIGEYLDRMDSEGHRAGVSREDLEAAKFPLVAFIDETILNSSWEGREAWRERPIQLDKYGETVAGERFFERLERLRAQGESKAELLEIYYLCLSLGFEGKYKILGKEKLRALVDDLRRELGYARPLSSRVPIAPHGRRKEVRRSASEQSFPFLQVAAVSVGGLLVLWIIFFFVMGHLEGDALQKLGTLPN